MSKQKRILKIILQFISGFITACCVFFVLDGFLEPFDPKSTLEDWLVLFMIMPIGSLSGIFLIDKLLFRAQGYNVLGMTIGFLLGFVSIAFVEWFLPFYWGVDMFPVYSFIENYTIIGNILTIDGIRYAVFYPLTTTLFSLAGYTFILLFRLQRG